ncbi:3-phosphoserine/phosphohydroxythreonine transaminase [Sphingobacterium psychroaquaticum]|uniref:Phosphoserine aminotransferase n=1 Tax=Sphingobacterium psychroaquaticum TaxID=561061 RepID=A0A1X7IXV2_9SPHI|nr:3-phosphoserine/phosphohydroxythreonine transaminase [Sphingobacterium psychroaquaticum]QBQ40313.1 3-phosphoserine/phosphohydroxythreonine transaminase [Sphingobacterium psychroaquaticum]SMG19976.1 phosphoserine aminotransferase apoenzyme [Sphingobacterium psychroaquaticum]
MKYNFGAGPGKLAKEVLEEASKAITNFNNTGLSILEISHRSQYFMDVVDEAESLVRDLLEVPETHDIIFLQGGASTQFAMVPMNLLPPDGFAAYLDTGVWANKAIQEAKRFGEVVVVGSSINANYNFLPRDFKVSSNVAYFHYTSNNTIYGTAFSFTPEVTVPLVCDMSSDIFSRRIDVSKYNLIYAGAQKNAGPAGLTIVIIKKGILGHVKRVIPFIFDYRLHIENKSMYNTPAVYAIYVAMLNFRWLTRKGGVAAIELENNAKAALLYREIDDNPLFVGTARTEDRSRMNVTFTMVTAGLEQEFLNFSRDRYIIGIEGHRSTGGFRVSLYNAVTLQDVEVLVSAMREFSTQKEHEIRYSAMHGG